MLILWSSPMEFCFGIWVLLELFKIGNWSLYPISWIVFMESHWGGEDKICCMLAKKSSFKVSLYYRVLTGSSDQSFPWKSIWKPKVPSRVTFFFLIVALGKMLTIDILLKGKIWIWDWCFMCKSNGESVDHLLIHCPIATELWSMVFTLFGIH